MFTTKSHILLGPVTDTFEPAQKSDLVRGIALLLVGHGVRGPCAAASIGPHENLVNALRQTGQFKEIRWGYLTCEPYAEDVLGSFQSDAVYVLPMLMSDGYFSKKLIPSKLSLDGPINTRANGQKIIQCLPIGLSKLMGDMMVQHMQNHCAKQKLDEKEITTVIIGHGSTKDSASRIALSMQVEHVKNLNIFKNVQAAFLEESPDLPTVLKDVEGKVLIMGYFANFGNHAVMDMSLMMQGRDANVTYLGPVGGLPAMQDVVLDSIVISPS